MIWTDEDQKKFVVLMEDILPYIRFPIMTSQDIATKVKPMNLLSNHQVLELFTYFAKISAGQKPKLGKSLKFSSKERKGRAPPALFRWDKSKKHGTLVLSSDCLTASSTTSNYQPVFGDTIMEKGVFQWEVILKTMYNNTYSVNIGVVPATQTGHNQNFMIGYSGHINGWAFACGHGYKYHSSQTPYGSICHTGDVVRVKLDCDKKTIEFFKNGKSLGVAWTDLITPLRAAISLYGTNTTVLQFPRTLS